MTQERKTAGGIVDELLVNSRRLNNITSSIGDDSVSCVQCRDNHPVNGSVFSGNQGSGIIGASHYLRRHSSASVGMRYVYIILAKGPC